MLVLSNLIAQRIYLHFIFKIIRGICTQWKVRKNESEENNKCTLLFSLFLSLENVPAFPRIPSKCIIFSLYKVMDILLLSQMIKNN